MPLWKLLYTRSGRALTLFTICFVAACAFSVSQFAAPALAQVVPGSGDTSQSDICPEFINQVIETLEQNCSSTDRNTACYGNTVVSATFNNEVPEGYFSQPADRADLINLQTISTTQLALEDGAWGVALMNMQANLPGSLPGQSVNFLLFGDATVVNTVPLEEAVLPADPVPVIANSAVAIRTLPDRNANLAGSVPAGVTLQADALDITGNWVRVGYEATDGAMGGWVPVASLEPFERTGLPVISSETRTPMQAFLFRTGLGQPACAEAPNQVLIQGPENTEVTLNVNGADIIVGSTVIMTSVTGAPPEILAQLDLPDEIINQFNEAEAREGEEQCAVMQLTVVNGEVTLNEGQIGLPEGNHAYSVYCGPPLEEDPNSPLGQVIDFSEIGVDFASDWGAFRTMTAEEIEELRAMEAITESLINYEIELPDPNSIQPVVTNTPTPTPTVSGVGFAATLTLTPEATIVPTETPWPATPRPGAGYAAQGSVPPAAATQSSTVGQPLPVPFQMTVQDPYGDPVSGTTVTFIAPASGASGTFAGSGTNSATATSDSSGFVIAPPFTGNTVAGTYTVLATVPSGTVLGDKDLLAKPAGQEGVTVIATFTVTNTPSDPAAINVYSGDGQQALYNTTFGAALQVQVVDQYGNGVPARPVSFIAPSGGTTANFSGSSTANAVTNASGIATSPLPSANAAIGTYAVLALSGSFTTSFTLSNLPPQVVIVSGSPQTATVNTDFAQTLQVQVLNPVTGSGLSGLNVTFAAPGSGASGRFGEPNTAEVVTNGPGFATAPTFTANIVAGNYAVTASTVFGANAQFDMTNTAGPASALQVTAGSPQTTTVNTAFTTQLSFLLQDAFSNPVPGADITISAPPGGATGVFASTGVNTETITTNALGIATSSAFTASTVAGIYELQAISGSATTSFPLTNAADTPVVMDLISGTPQSAQVNTVFAEPFVVLLRDQYNNFVPGINVTFSAPPSGASGTFLSSGTNSVIVASDSGGGVNSGSFRANTAVGSYSVTATTGSLSQTFNLSNMPGNPANVIKTQGDGQSATVNTGYSSALQVRIEDAFGNVVPGVNVTFTPPGGGASVSFSGSNVVTTNTGGVATAPSMTANTVAGAFAVSATAGSATTNFALTNQPGAATSMAIHSGNNQTAQVGTAFASPLQARVQDSFGNGVPGHSVSFSGPGSGASVIFSATGTNTQSVNTDASGIATSSSFSANGIVGMYGLVVNASGVGNDIFVLENTPPPPIVTNLNDSGPGSLRDIVSNATPGSTVTFSVTGMITLTSGGINIPVPMTIDGPGAGSLTISGNNNDLIFHIPNGVSATIQDVRLTQGRRLGLDTDGGAIYIQDTGSLTLNFVQIDNSTSDGDPCCEKGGAIFSQGSLTITNSGFYNNQAQQMASAIAVWSNGDSLSITNSCFVGNVLAGNSAGLAVSSGIGTVSGNWWGNSGGPGVGGANSTFPADSSFATAPIAGVPGC